MKGARAFREAFVSADLLDPDDFTDADARRLRYEIYWSLYESSIYRNIHKWAQKYKVDFGLYRYVRAVYNPAYQIGEFYKNHLWGGLLDPEAGDGKSKPSALPIVTDSDTLRSAIGKLWLWSNWQTRKDIVSLYGSVMGDTAIKVVDNVKRGKVYLQEVHPGTLIDVLLDDAGNVKGYTIEEERADPRRKLAEVRYREVVTREGDNVKYQTFLNDTLYAWNGDAAEWSEPYGFVPLVMIQHNNIGLDWGWSELHPAQPKFREVDDLASKLTDQIRKMVDAPWLFSGVDDPAKKKKTVTTTADQPTANSPEASREDVPALYAPQGATATALVAPLDIASTTAYIESILKSLEKDYPELAVNMAQVTGDPSGRALRINRQPAEIKVQQRRPNYDDALVRAQQMAVAIAGFRGLDGFAGFNLDSYDKGDLDHSIGQRPVFASDPMDDLELDRAFWDMAVVAKNAGYDLDLLMKRRGWSEEDIKAYKQSSGYKAREAAVKQLTNPNPNPDPGQPPVRRPINNQPGGPNG